MAAPIVGVGATSVAASVGSLFAELRRQDHVVADGASLLAAGHHLAALAGQQALIEMPAEDKSVIFLHSDERAEKHFMIDEKATVDAIRETRARGGRVVAVGTTSLRALEAAAQSGKLHAGSGETDIFITPGYRFHVIDALITNFHLPRSTLLMLVSAFAGVDAIRAAYAHAIAERYRFFSYGDAMFLEKRPQ